MRISDWSSDVVLCRSLQHGPAEIGVLGPLLLADELADPRPRLAGDREALPLRRRPGGPRRDDLHLVAVGELMAPREQPAYHLGSHAGVADLRLDRIGEVDRTSVVMGKSVSVRVVFG